MWLCVPTASRGLLTAVKIKHGTVRFSFYAVLRRLFVVHSCALPKIDWSAVTFVRVVHLRFHAHYDPMCVSLSRYAVIKLYTQSSNRCRLHFNV